MVPKIYSQFYKQRVVTLEEIRELFPDAQQARNAVSYLIKNNYARRVKAGLYYLIPFEQQGTDWQPDVLIVGSKIAKDYYYSHASAFTIFGILAAPPPRIAISVPVRFRRFKYGMYNFYPVETSEFFGFKDMDYKGITIRVSDMERTMIDSLSRLDLSGGVIGAFRNLSLLGFINYPLHGISRQAGQEEHDGAGGICAGLFRNRWEVDQDVLKELI